ncbi:MAG: NAD-dependent epimerase/dehydratase family protein [Halioglobus sp.]
MTVDTPCPGVALVFGASGYIGSNLVPFLAHQGLRVRAVSRNRAVLEGREWAGEVLRQVAVPVTEVRAGMIIGPGSAALEVIRDLVNNLPLMVTPKWVFSRSPPIALPDLLAYLSAVAKLPADAGQIYDAAGPEILTYAEIMRRLASMLHRKIVIIPVPVLTPKLSSYWLWLVTSVPVNVARR